MRDYSNWRKKWEADQEHRQLCFARYCWVRRGQVAPSGLFWEESFENREGISLSQYATERMRERSRKEKQESRNKS